MEDRQEHYNKIAKRLNDFTKEINLFDMDDEFPEFSFDIVTREYNPIDRKVTDCRPYLVLKNPNCLEKKDIDLIKVRLRNVGLGLSEITWGKDGLVLSVLIDNRKMEKQNNSENSNMPMKHETKEFKRILDEINESGVLSGRLNWIWDDGFQLYTVETEFPFVPGEDLESIRKKFDLDFRIFKVEKGDEGMEITFYCG